MVITHPPGSRPGISSFAIIPAISPKIIQLSIPTATPLLYVTAHLRLLCGTALRLYRGAVILRHRLETVEHGAVRLYGLKGETPAIHVHKHRVVGGPRAGRQSTLARRVEPPAASPAYDVHNAPYRHGAFVDMVVAREDEVHTVLREERREVMADRLVAAMSGGAVGGSVQERDLQALARGGQVAL